MQNILVVNAGSSSIKYQLIDARSEARVASGLIERIGEPLGAVTHKAEGRRIEWEAPIKDHGEGFAQLQRAFAQMGAPLEQLGILAVGHRVVQGGKQFVEPTLIDVVVADRILELAELAPLHNPGHHSAILAAQAVFPDVPHVAVFDTAFHQTMPEVAYTYAIDRKLAEKHDIRRYGFHGISHQVVSRRAAKLLGASVEEIKQIVLHLGNGASACAIDGGKSVDTSMGFTPLEGLVMGTRGGDLDPGVLVHLLRSGETLDEVDDLLNRRSGLNGMAGSNDMRDVRRDAESGSDIAQLALDVYARRIRHYVGAYLVELGGADTIVFTAGVGENHAVTRSEVCRGLEWFGIEIDEQRNSAVSGEAAVISTDSSRVAVLVVPTDEEAEIAKQTLRVIQNN